MEEKIQALAKCLGVNESEIVKNDDAYYLGNMGYLVLRYNEVYNKVKEEIEDCLWAFQAKFILNTCGFSSGSEIAESFEEMLGKACESANPFVRALIDGTCGITCFVREAILANGEAHFLARYDDKELSVEVDGVTYFIYRVD